MKQESFISRFAKACRENSRLSTILTAVLIAVIVVLNTIIFGMANKFTWYFQGVTELKHEIGSGTDNYVGEVADAGDVTIIFCDMEDALTEEPVFNLVLQTARQFEEKYDFITVEFVNIYTDPHLVEEYKYETDAESGEKKQINTINSETVIFDAENGDFAVLPMQSFFILDSDQVIVSYNGEEVTAAMLHRVQTMDTRPTAYFTKSHGEEFSPAFMNRLICAGYTLREIDLIAEDLTYEDGDILVISNPKYDFIRGSEAHGVIGELDKIEMFLSAGGSVLAMLDPLVTNTVKLEGFLADWGITVERAEADDQMRDTIMVQDSVNSLPIDVYTLVSEIGEEGIAGTIREQMQEIDAGGVIIRNASPISLDRELNGKEVSSLLSASTSAESHANGELVDSDGGYTIAAISRDTTTGGSVFAVSSVYLTAEDALATNEYGNRDLIFFMLEHMSGISMPTGGTQFIFEETTIEDLTMWEARVWATVLAVLLPLAAAATGAVILIKRRNR